MNQDRQALRALLLRHIDHIDVKDDGTCIIYPFLGESSISGTVWGRIADIFELLRLKFQFTKAS